ncbi:MAG: hypothetical protein JWO81_1725 [Alphaproteobacteria bacterium]|nr:hypothetical protein [Alphaproteobacteria bacterium]
MATIDAGYDLFSVVPGSTLINLDSIFPGAGIIRSNGVPIDPKRLGSFSTGLIRNAALENGQSGAIPITWFAEHSVSAKPVNLAPFGLGKGRADYHTIINAGGVLPNLPNTDGLVRPSEGVMVIRRSRGGGGRFEFAVNINPLIVLTKVGGRVSNLEDPDIIKVIDGSGLLNPVGSIGGQWAEVRYRAGTRTAEAFPSGSNFAAGLDRNSAEPVKIGLTSGGVEAERDIVIWA